MAELAVVRRYARALFDTANRSGAVDQVETDLRSLDEIFRSVPRLLRALRAPTASSARKRALLESAFSGRVTPLTQRFMALAVDRGREDILGDIYPEFQRMANELRNILPVEVTAATELTQGERDALGASLAQRTGKRIVLQVSVDPSIKGGLIIRMGDTILDGSVRTRLAQLRDRLMTGAGI